MSKFGQAYIGCGGIARTRASELVQTDDNTIIAAWNRTKEKAESFVEDFGGKVYDTAEEAIRAEGVEGVYVNVNGDQHAYYTKLAIDLGKPVLCEKPFTFNEKETKDLLDYAAEKGVYVSEAMWTWHNDTALGGALMDLGVYNVRYAYELFGKQDRIECESNMHEVEHSEDITFHYPGFNVIPKEISHF